jgi:hypothetical protein
VVSVYGPRQKALDSAALPNCDSMRVAEIEVYRLYENIYAELLDLNNIKAEVSYRELGIDDGGEIREEDDLQSGSVRKAVITAPPKPGSGTPGVSSLVFFHVSFMSEDDDILISSREEHGGSGEPLLYLLTNGRWRPLRGLEIALVGMSVGERSIVAMKPSMCMMHPDVDDSWMARELKKMLDLDCRLAYKADLELVGWLNDFTAVPTDGDRVAFKKTLVEGQGWETPRVPFNVQVKIVGHTPDLFRPRQITHPERTLTFDMGDGTMPAEIESVICTMLKGEEVIAFCPLGNQSGSCQGLQEGYIEYKIELIDMVQARDLMGDGQTMKKIIKKGRGEFPMDCPMEDTRVVFKAKIRAKDTGLDTAWLPLLSASIEDEKDLQTGMGELPIIIDAALRLMLIGEVSLLETTVDDALRIFCGSFPAGEKVEIELELVRFDAAKPVQVLDPSEKLVKSKELKADGNILYKKGLYSLAKSKYHKSLGCVGKAYEFSDDDVSEALGIKVSCLLNLAACDQQLGLYPAAISWCDRVLEDHPDNSKAYYRRCRAKQSMSLFEEALEDLEAMVTLDSALAADVSREKSLLMRRWRSAEAKQTRELRDFFSRG